MSWVLVLAIANLSGGVDTRALGYKTEQNCLDAKRTVDAWVMKNRVIVAEAICLPQWAGPQ